VQVLKTNRVMQSLMTSTGLAEIVGFSHQVLLPVLAKEVLHIDAAGLGVLMAFRSAGNVLGVLMLSILAVVRRRGVLLLGVLGLFGIGQVFLAQATSFWIAVGCVTFINVMASSTDILHHTLLQLSVSNEQRGRAMGSWIVGTGAAPIGHLEIGQLAVFITAPLALLVNGITLTVLAVVLTVSLPRLRRL
jgi:predicted MFS family arabinose efflux permease